MFYVCLAADWASFGVSVPVGGGGAVRAHLGLRVSGCHTVGNHMPRLKILLSYPYVHLCLGNFRC